MEAIKNIKQEVVQDGGCKDSTSETKHKSDSKVRNKRKAENNIENDLEIKQTANLNLVQIKEELVDFLDTVSVEINETDEVDNMNLYNEVNNEVNAEFEAEKTEVFNLPIKFEVKDKPEEVVDASGNNTLDSDFSSQNFKEDSSVNR